jgi:hypothetical protein
MVALPIDAVKVRLQTDDLAAPKFRGAIHGTRPHEPFLNLL